MFTTFKYFFWKSLPFDLVNGHPYLRFKVGIGIQYTSTAAHAGTHTQNVYGSRDDSVCITFAECEKIELKNTYTQNTNLNLHQTSPNT